MKKIAVIFLLLIYGTATMGATVHLHYCMDEFVGWSLFSGKDDTCGKCGMEEKDKEGCCKDEQKHLKLKVDQQKTNVVQFISFISAPVTFTAVIDIDFQSYLSITENYPTCHAPPDIGQKRLHVFYGVFLI